MTRLAKFRLHFAFAWLCLALPLTAQTYSPPAPRLNVDLDSGWRFIRQDVAGAQTNGFDDTSWTALDLPHTWNNLDGQDGGNNYYRGIGWYRRHYTVDSSQTNRHFFLKFDGANIVSDVYINGNLVGEHQGGFAAFVFDVTTNLNLGADNLVAVKVNNASNTNVPPLSADFTFFGGIYRDVHLLVTDPLHISPLDFGSPGVYLKPTNVSSNSANLQVTTVLSNAYPTAASVTVRTIITDAATNIVKALTNVVVLPAASASNVVASTTIANPHLWNGLADPYLYQAFVEIYNGTNLTDVVSQPLGFRWFSVDPTNGFFLNGRYYDLHGVSVHQDWLNNGWALNNAQRDTNFMFLKELGVTAYRMAHYQKNDYEYQLADRNGIVLWSEIGLVNSVTESTNFYNNAKQQLRELIRQNYNHPAVVCWGMYNELTLGVSTATTNLVYQLVQLEAQEDPTRPSTAAVLGGNGDANAWYPQIVAFNEYYGWYSSPLNGLAAWADAIHAAHPTNCIGVSEYGAGASIYQHSENPVAWPTTTSSYHPEEWQNLVHETNWALLKARPFIWCKFIWNMFNFASDGRNEGDTPGRNDKGLVTYDRLTRKDAFYFYMANWTTNPMVYITGHTFTNRLTNIITAKVYANCDSVELFVNGISQGARTSTNYIFTWPATLVGGTNLVQAIGIKGGTNVTDSLTWIAPFGLGITSPLAPVVYLNGTNDTLQLSAAITNSTGQVLVSWSQASGPGTVFFGNSNALATSARFTVSGIYRVTINANSGPANSSAGVTVVVGANNFVTNGLIAWWKMDETSGPTAADASGNNVTATLSNVGFTSGYLSNAFFFNGSSSAATFASPDTAQITLAGWVRADADGNSVYPRVFDTPGYRLFYRFDGSGSNGFDFATYSTVNGDWFSGANTVSLGKWYHVAASYDRSSFANLPTLYVNGVKQVPTTITSPSGTQPSYSGTGYIGNKSGLTRAWDGAIDDLRIYNRLLSDTEVQVLAAMPMTNLAPVVNAGTNQIVVWPAAASLNGTVSDDGNPFGGVTLNWSQFSGSGVAAFANSNSASATVTFSAPGNYGLRLVADDGQIKTSSDISVAVIVRPTITGALTTGALRLSWDAASIGWRLQVQTNATSVGLRANWLDVAGANATNAVTMAIDPAGAAVFYRLVYP